MRDFATSPAVGILDEWRGASPGRNVTLRRSDYGWSIMTSLDDDTSVTSSSFCLDASGLEKAAHEAVAATERMRLGRLADKVTRLRRQLAAAEQAEAERADLERASSTERAATDCERDAREGDAAE